MGSGPRDRDDAAALRARLHRLVGELKGRTPPPPPPRQERPPQADGMGSAMSMGLRAGSEFVSAIIVGSGIGWVLDRALGTNPAFLIVFFMIGVAAGAWNVIRRDFAKRRRLPTAIRPCLAQTRRIKTGGARLLTPNGTPRWGGAGPRRGARASGSGRTTTRTRGVATEAGPAINPIEQFSIHPVVPIRSRAHDFSLTNSGLFMLLAVALSCLLVAIGARGGAGVPGRMQAMAEMAYEFVAGMVRSAAGEDGHAVLPVRLLHLHVRPALQPGRLHPLFLHGDEPDRHHRRAGAAGVPHRRRRRRSRSTDCISSSCSCPPGVPIYILPLVVAIEIVSFFVPPGQPFGASVRQHAGRPHHALRVRRASSSCCSARAP